MAGIVTPVIPCGIVEAQRDASALDPTATIGPHAIAGTSRYTAGEPRRR